MTTNIRDLPPVNETHRIIYRVDTGIIVAIVTISTEEGAITVDETSTLRLTRSVAEDSCELALIEVQDLPDHAVRVDVETRSLIPAPPHSHEGLVPPAVIPRP